ncbi:LOW QUALITY PROTEIN: sodium/potassium-transporting ATPase subunit beta-2-like [Alca torda]
MAREKEKRSCGQVLAEWKAFVWDPRSRQFLGRTGTSWGLILLFYLVFYGFLAGLFALTMWVMLQSFDPHIPEYHPRDIVQGIADVVDSSHPSRGCILP